ncbi:MAG: hypothetical protein SVX38_08900 [Chloroflexota bacterium]|nr:hypothetical protein [Chloroflexota bacterium]
MATEMKKLAAQMQVAGLIIQALTSGIWDMVGEGSFALSSSIGDGLLAGAERGAGLEIAGEKPEDVLTELGRLFVDELGFCQAVNVESDGDAITMTVEKCMIASSCAQFEQAGVGFFYCPYLCVGLAALKRLGMRARSHVDFKGTGSVITFDML